MPSAIVRRLLFWSPWVLAVAVILVFLLQPDPVPVDIVAVQRGQIVSSISEEGQTRVKEVFVVSAPVPGLMRRIELHAGDVVTAGETVVAQIEPSDPAFLDVRSMAEAEAAIRAAEANERFAAAAVQRADAELDFARAELRRFEQLVERDTISANELEAAQRRARIADAALEEARASLKARSSELEQAKARLIEPTSARNRQRANLGYIAVYTPVSGTVLRVPNESEAVVAAGTPLIEIGDPRQLEVVVDLLSTEAVNVEAGQRVLIEAWGGAEPLDGVVYRVEPYGFTKVSALGVEEQRVKVLVELVDPPEQWRKLGHGFRVHPRVILAEAEDILKLPRAALFRDGERWAVFVAVGEMAELRHVELGLQNSLEAQIVAGLQEGERVVLQPGGRVSHGTLIAERG
ncbi:MAG: HlyD family efflux transporter periplasmic adaptor subunit [Gammaproteobacteria bacterium]|nr:HlyD family efflux transporter periplasmic adaptor subunit [Gammaproteobacteria bacterium]